MQRVMLSDETFRGNIKRNHPEAAAISKSHAALTKMLTWLLFSEK